MNVHIDGAFSLSKVNYVSPYKKLFSTIFKFLNDDRYSFVCLAKCFIGWLFDMLLILGANYFMFIRNKVMIVTAGAIPSLAELLEFQNSSIRELAAAAVLTLSAVAPNKKRS